MYDQLVAALGTAGGGGRGAEAPVIIMNTNTR